jgi:acetyltransferase-like isoleucine patch superfamily enzyme
MRLRTLLTGFAVLILPWPFRRMFLNLLGHHLAGGTRIGWGLVFVDRLCMNPGSSIGSFNILRCHRIVMREKSSIGRFNSVRGPLSVRLGEGSVLGNRNVVARSWALGRYSSGRLWLGTLSGITAGHSLDCTRSITFGDYVTLAGKASQCWTHGYIFEAKGAGRARIDGPIRIGNNVSIGSGCIISMGVKIVDAVTIGSLSSVSKSLLQPGLYVSQPLRYIDKDFDAMTRSLEMVSSEEKSDRVYRKPDPS